MYSASFIILYNGQQKHNLLDIVQKYSIWVVCIVKDV